MPGKYQSYCRPTIRFIGLRQWVVIQAPASYVRVPPGRFFAGPDGPRRSRFRLAMTDLRIQFRIMRRIGVRLSSLARPLTLLARCLLPGTVVRCVRFLLRGESSVSDGKRLSRS